MALHSSPFGTKYDVKKGIKLDVGCGGNKQKYFVGMDLRELPGVDIVHNLEVFPWPLHNDSCVVIVASHIVEHIQPKYSIPFMNECWRVMEEGGELLIATPYPGSMGFWQDPTHCNGWNQATFQYFDPHYPLYNIYKPKPWSIKKGFPVWQLQGNLEVILTKLPEQSGKSINEVNSGTLSIAVAEDINTKDRLV